VAAIVAILASAAAAAESPPVIDDPQAIVLTPMLIVAPDFPKEAIERRQSGHVDVEGILAGDGRVHSWTLTPDSEASRIFVSEVEQVIAHWRWRRPLGKGCVPADTPIRTRVWFEWEGDRHKISVQRASRVAPKPAAGAFEAKPVKRVAPAYPREMIRAGWKRRSSRCRMSVPKAR
jgi:hypothetical protein